jgi:hypothetical protein
MNYIIEDDFDFYSALKAETTVNTPTSVCMISHEPLTYNAITLSCNHSFNYLPLFNELCLYNNKSSIHCPYCRTKSDKLIPYIPLPNVTKIYGVNSPSKWCMPTPKCAFIVKTGLACEHNGIEYANGIFCDKHFKCTMDSVWTEEKALLLKTKSVVELRKMLREKGLKVCGIKKELVNRLYA